MPIRTVKTPQVTVAGGTATAKTTVPVSGQLMSVRVQQGGSPNATLTFTDDNGQTLLTLAANTQTDKTYYPRRLLDDTSGVALTAIYDKLAVDGYITCAVTSGNNGQTLIVTCEVLEDGRYVL